MQERQLPEAIRNRLLRRADWRFLLPTPVPQHAITLAGGALGDAVRLIAPSGSAPAPDLAVAADPDDVALKSLVDRLAPGGACYTEWRFRGPRSVRRSLEAAGFAEVSLYWPWPWPAWASPWFWAPVESRSARSFLLATRLPARNPIRRAIDRPLRALWPLAHGAGWLRPVCAVARKPATGVGTENGAAHSLGMLDWIKQSWSDWGLGPVPDQLTWLLLTRGPRAISKVVGLVFAEPEPTPRLVVKRPRVPEAGSGLERESVALSAVHALRRGGMPGVPRLLAHSEPAGYPALVETALSGRPLFSLLNPTTYRDLALRATDWLTDLLAQRRPRPPRGAAPLLENAMRDFRRSFGALTDGDSLRRTEQLLEPLGDLPSVVEQRDFSPWNVHVAEDGKLVIFDWESAELDGMPLLDLIYFLSYLAFFHDGAIAPDKAPLSYRRTLDPSSFTGGVQQECLERYAAQLGLDRALIHPLRLLTWLIHSRSDYRHLSADAAGPPKPGALRGSLFFRLWQEELRA